MFDNTLLDILYMHKGLLKRMIEITSNTLGKYYYPITKLLKISIKLKKDCDLKSKCGRRDFRGLGDMYLKDFLAR